MSLTNSSLVFGIWFLVFPLVPAPNPYIISLAHKRMLKARMEMDFLFHFIGSAVTAILFQVMFSRRGLHRSPAPALLSALIWLSVFLIIKHTEWGWKTGPWQLNLPSALNLFRAFLVWSVFLFPITFVTGWLCRKMLKPPLKTT